MSYEKQQRVIKYFQQLGTFVKKANEATVLLARLDAESALAPMDQATTRIVNEQRKALEELWINASEHAVKKARCVSFQAAEGLTQQIEARIDSVDELARNIRSYEAQLELAISLDELTQEERAQAEENLGQLRARFERQLDLADQLVPADSSILEIA